MPDLSDLAYALSGSGSGLKNDQFAYRRKLAMALAQQGSDSSPIISPWQGAARLGQALAGAYGMYQADADEKEATKKRTDALAQAMAEPDPQKRIGLIAAYDPDTGARAAGQLAIEQAKIKQQRDALEAGANNFGGAYGGTMQGGGGANGAAIAGIESAGHPNGGYGAIGPVANAQGNRAYGRYQVLDSNIGPWTQEVLGKAMTPQEFLANPDAQNKVFETKFGQMVTQYGSPQAASRAWFAGPGGMNNPGAKDVNGMSVAQYQNRFSQGLGQGGVGNPAGGATGGFAPPDVARATSNPAPLGAIASPPQMAQGDVPGVPAPAPAAPPGGAGMAPPGVPDVPRPQPSPQQIQQFQQRLRSGEFGLGPDAVSKARAALDADLDRQWQVDRERRFKEFDLQSGDYRAGRDQQLKAPQEAFTNEAKLRNEFEQQPAVKSFRVVVPMLESAKDAATRPTRAADLNLVYAFAKLMDPDSVVRESETAGVVATASVADRLQAYIGQLNGQAMLNPDVRAKLMAELDSRYKALEASHAALSNQYADIAKAHGLEPGRVVIPIRTGRESASAQGDAGGVLQQAREAISRGAPRDQVIQRLQGMGVPTDGL